MQDTPRKNLRKGPISQSDVSLADCVAMQILYDVYSLQDLMAMFDITEKEAWRHANGKCKVHSPDGLLDQQQLLTKYECLAARLLKKSGWSTPELKMVFEVGDGIYPHLNAECHAHKPDPETIPEFTYDQVVGDD